ncbi:MAG: pitrilysin family protein [Candidatus Izemoplasmatales bacterium]
MKKNDILMDEAIYCKTLSNGLVVYIHPKPKFVQTICSLHVNFGGRDFMYRVNNSDYTLPRGTAHFLEHMIFENNSSSFSKSFIENNADLNAFTARKLTSYYFSTKNNFSFLLKKLLDNFIEFNFSEKSIKKELQIISQELSMNDDSDSTKAYKSLVRMMYNNPTIYEDIGGTKNTIKKVDKEVLNQATRHFYHPKNMRLVITGNVNPENIINQLEEHPFVTAKWPDYYPVERVTNLCNNTRHLKIKYDKTLDTNIVEIGIKIPDVLFKNNHQKHYLLTDPFLEMVFNPSSKLYKELKKKNLYNHSLTVSPIFDGDYSFFNISIETKKPKLFVKTIKELLLELPQITFSEKVFNAYNRSEIGRTIKSFDDVKESHSLIENLLIGEIDITKYFEMKKKIKLDDFLVYQNIFVKSNIYIVEYLQEA